MKARPLRLFDLCTLCVALVAFTPAAHALTLEFPGPATATLTRQDAPVSYRLPIGPFADGKMQTRLVEGALDQTVWRIVAPGMTTLALLVPLRDQLAQDGWTTVFECETEDCGGFDFRYGTEIVPEPDMHVDLSDFRFIAAERSGPDGPEVLSLIVSRSTESGFVQLIRVGATLPAQTDVRAPEAAAQAAVTTQPALPAPDDIAGKLETGGSLALDDLVFASGAAALADGDYASLAALSAYLAAHPDRAIAIVGHTDASGGLDANIALSKKRAASVRARMIETYGVSKGQVIAEGVGYLAPRTSNLTSEGRARNRRVEVMLTSTQ